MKLLASALSTEVMFKNISQNERIVWLSVAVTLAMWFGRF